MKKLYNYWAPIFAGLIIGSVIASPLAYASESHHQIYQFRATQRQLQEIDKKLNSPQAVSNELVSELALKYNSISEKRIRKIADMVSSPYSTRTSIIDGQGVTLGEFAVVFDIVMSRIITGGVSKIGQIVEQNGASYARSLLSRAAARVGVLTGWLTKILDVILPFISFYSNIGYSIAGMIDARDFHTNKGRINAWA